MLTCSAVDRNTGGCLQHVIRDESLIPRRLRAGTHVIGRPGLTWLALFARERLGRPPFSRGASRASCNALPSRMLALLWLWRLWRLVGNGRLSTGSGPLQCRPGGQVEGTTVLECRRGRHSCLLHRLSLLVWLPGRGRPGASPRDLGAFEPHPDTSFLPLLTMRFNRLPQLGISGPQVRPMQQYNAVPDDRESARRHTTCSQNETHPRPPWGDDPFAKCKHSARPSNFVFMGIEAPPIPLHIPHLVGCSMGPRRRGSGRTSASFAEHHASCSHITNLLYFAVS